MNRPCSIALALGLLLNHGLYAQAPPAKGAAQGRAEQRLAQMLQPGARFDVTGPRVGPFPWSGPSALEQPVIPLSRYAGMPPRLDSPPGKPALPHPLAEGQPLASLREHPPPPRAVVLPTEPLLRLADADIREPLPLPILAQPQKDRASLLDPTLEASVAAALMPLTPARTQPLPFAPLNLPDPFENIPTGQVRNPPDENPMPPAIPLRTPGR